MKAASTEYSTLLCRLQGANPRPQLSSLQRIRMPQPKKDDFFAMLAKVLTTHSR